MEGPPTLLVAYSVIIQCGLVTCTPDNHWSALAIAAVAAAGIEYESVGKPILTIQDAIAAGSFFDNPGASPVVVGDAKGMPTA